MPSHPQRLTDRVAIVTGAAGGIGAATCLRLAAEGARVVVADRDERGAEEVARDIGERATAISFDAADPESVRSLVEQTVETHGRLDVLHNNAAFSATSGDTNVTDIDLDIWEHAFDVNVRGYLLGCKHAIPHMIESGGGSIIMTTSGAADRGAMERLAYGCSKAAVNNLTRFVATQYGKQGITCNAVSPGVVLTEGARQSMAPEMIGILERNTLVDRLGHPDDVAGAVAYLASDEAAYITGTVLYLDGGMAAHAPYHSDVIQAFADRGTFLPEED